MRTQAVDITKSYELNPGFPQVFPQSEAGKQLDMGPDSWTGPLRILGNGNCPLPPQEGGVRVQTHTMTSTRTHM